MRRFLASLCAATLMLLCACSGSEKTIRPEDIDYVFSCKADISAAGQTCTAELNRAGPGVAAVKIVSGAGDGLAWYWNGDNFTQTYLGLSAESETCILPKGAFAAVLVDVLDESEKHDSLTRVGGNVFSGSCSDGDFTLTVDGSTGCVTQIDVPGWSISAKLYDYNRPTLSDDVLRDFETE